MKIVLEIEQGSGIRPNDDPSKLFQVLAGEIGSIESAGISTTVQGSGPPPNALGIDQAIHFAIENPEVTKALISFATRFLSIAYSMWRDYWPVSKLLITVGDKTFHISASHDDWAELESELSRLRESLESTGSAE